MGSWTPILSESDTAVCDMACRVWPVIDAIADAVWTRNYPPLVKMQRQFIHSYDEVVLYGYLAKAKRSSVWAERAVQRLNEAIEYRIAVTTSPNLALFGGLCGLGWVVEHVAGILDESMVPLCSVSEASAQDEDLNADLDSILLATLERPGKWRDQYDLINGLVGIGVYLLERLPIPTAARAIELMVERFEGLAERQATGLTWRSGPELLPESLKEQCRDGYHNLGVAHGIPGVMHFLSEVAAAGIRREQCLDVLDKTFSWFALQQRPRGSRSRFPPWIGPCTESRDSRLAWCYGDLGILAVLSQIVRRTTRLEWQVLADDLFEHCVNWPDEQAGANDAPFCHGAAGLAHTFNRLYQTTGDRRCLRTALHWLECVLQMQRPGNGVAGYSMYTRPLPDNEVIWEPWPGLLDGAIGIALTLLASVTDIEPGWDRMLLLSGRQHQNT